MTVKSYSVEYYSSEEFEELDFDCVDVEVDEQIFNEATEFVKNRPTIESIKIEVDLDKISFFKYGNVSPFEIPISSCHVIITKLFSFCRIMLDSNEEVLVECSEIYTE